MKISKLFIITLALNLFITHLISQDVIWHEEAENGVLSGAADINQACEYASNGEFVRLYADAGNGLKFNNISVTDAGLYHLKVDYFYVGNQVLEVFVNDISAGLISFPSAQWCYQGSPAEKDIYIDLVSGNNSIEFKPANEVIAPFIDKVELMAYAKPGVNISASPTRILPGRQVEIVLEASAVVANDEWIDLMVKGIPSESFTLDNSHIIITNGSSTGMATLTIDDQDLAHGTSFTVSITNSSEGLMVGESDSVQLRAIQHPELLFISSSEGSDLNDGLSSKTPWKTLKRISTTSLLPGDSILFKANDLFFGQLKVNGSGTTQEPIYFGSYGKGAQPVLDGANDSGGAYAATVIIENEDNIIMSDLTIKNDRKVTRTGVSDEEGYGINVINSGDRIMRNFYLKNLTIQDIFAVSTEGVEFNKLQTAAIHLRSFQNTTLGNEKNISDVLIEDCYITHTNKAGVWSRHSGGTNGIGNDSINRNMNIVIRNNHFYETGGSGVILSRSYNCLLEHNIFEYTGSNVDPRMAKRGSGAWFWNSRNILAQFNKSMHVRGPNDSYGMHIDFANRNVFLQYNYSEDSEGGFVEILGDNVNSVYRFNVSVNDGFRDKKGNTLWISDYAGGSGIRSDSNYIYNNTVYVDAAITPDISINAENTFIYNNIFVAEGDGVIGQNVEVSVTPGSKIDIANNLYFGNVMSEFSFLDPSSVMGDPQFVNPGASNIDGYRLLSGSMAEQKGIQFEEPVFPQAGKGIFKYITPTTEHDIYGNAVFIDSQSPNIGAYNSIMEEVGIFNKNDDAFQVNVKQNNNLYLFVEATKKEHIRIMLTDISGRVIYSKNESAAIGKSMFYIPSGNIKTNGIYFLTLKSNNAVFTKKIFMSNNYGD